MLTPRLWQLLAVAFSVQASIASQKRQVSDDGGILNSGSTSATDAVSTGISSSSFTDQSTTSVPAATSAAITTTTAPQTSSSSSFPVPSTSSSASTSSSTLPLTTTSTTAEAQQTTTTEATDNDASTPTSSTSGPESTTFDRTRSASHTTTDSPEETNTHSKIVTTKFVLVTRTNSDGTKSTMTSSEVTTSTPDLIADGNDDSSGMSTKTRNTIIGVVVGVGGAIILGALGLVAWRVWGRKRNSEENEAFMPYGQNEGYTGIEKSDHGSTTGVPSHSSPSPFQSTLENYHQPSSSNPVNAASNF